MNLLCPDCKVHTDHIVNPWQTAAGERGAICTCCEECGRLSIAELNKLPVLEFGPVEDGNLPVRFGVKT